LRDWFEKETAGLLLAEEGRGGSRSLDDVTRDLVLLVAWEEKEKKGRWAGIACWSARRKIDRSRE
jgi:hypothetical protein